MLLKVIAVATFALGTATLLLPRGENAAAQYPASDLTRSEMQLIASLRELARVPAEPETPVSREDAAGGVATVAVAEVPSVTEQAAERMVVVASSLNLREGPSTEARVLGSLREGQAVEVARRDGGWVQVATAEGATGWAYSDYLAVATQ